MSVAEFHGATAALIELIPVAGGALIGVLGGLAGTAYASRLSAKAEVGVERRTRLEALVTSCYEVEVWLKKEEGQFLFGGPEVVETSPIARIEAVAKLYFSELEAPTLELSKAYLAYRGWLIAGAQLRLTAKPPALPDGYLNDFQRFFEPVIAARDSLVDKSKDLMRDLYAP